MNETFETELGFLRIRASSAEMFPVHFVVKIPDDLGDHHRKFLELQKRDSLASLQLV